MSNQHQKWSKEEIIKSIQEFTKENDRTPRSNEFASKNKLPSYLHTLKILDCSLIEDIFTLCNLERTEAVVTNKIDKQWGLGKLIEYTKLLGRIPNQTDFKNNDWKPWYGWYNRNFGSFEDACFMAGLSEKPLNKEERINVSLSELSKLADILNKCPTVFEYEQVEHKGFVRRDLEKHLNMKYNDICKEYIPEYQVNHDKDIPKEKILKDVEDMLIENGSAMTFEQMKEKGLPYSFNTFGVKCGMLFNDVVSYLGYTPIGTTTEMRTREEMLEAFNNLYLKLKRVPYTRELDGENIAKSSTYFNHFGTVENICKLLNIDYSKHYRATGAGNISFDKNGGKCRSFMEQIISNYYIDNNLEFEKETSYNEFIDHDKRRFDWKLHINGKYYYVEYAGMYYPNKMNSSMNIAYVKKLDNKIKDLKDIGRYDECLFILPDDIKTKTLKEIFEPFFGIQLKENTNAYAINTVEYFTKTAEELLDIIMKYSNDPNILPSTSIISKKEQGAYKEIRKRYKTYYNFAVKFGKTTIYPPKKAI